MLKPSQSDQLPDLLTYTDHLNSNSRILPPPARVILLYAILGWGREQEPPASLGWQPLPPRQGWLPPFIRMIGARNRVRQICDYALAGLRFERAPVELLNTVERAFVVPGFDMMRVDALAEQSIR
jgi:hypothetical protein